MAESDLSTEVNATTVLPAPSSVSGSRDIDDVTITWTNNDDSPDGDIQIEVSEDGGSSWTSVTTGLSLTTTSYTNTNASHGTKRAYRVVRATAHTSSPSGSTGTFYIPTDPSSEVNATTVLPSATNLSGSTSTFDKSSVTNVDSGFISAPTSTGVYSYDVGFQPDVVVFTATSTNESGNSGSEVSETDDYGWMHSAVDFQNSLQRAIFSGSGSNSTNGQATETTTGLAINILELPNDGNGINNRIQASATATSTGFDLDFTSVGQAEQIQYRAYSFDSSGGVEIGFLNAPTSTGVQSVSTSISPDFVRFVGQPRATTANETVQDGNDHGIAHGWLTADTQYAMAFASYSNNVDDHVYGARDTSCLLVKHQGSKGGVTGTTEATGTLTSGGFDLDYSSVDGVGETILYITFSADEDIELASLNAPESTGVQTISGDFRELHATANATIESLNVDGYSGSNQDSVTYGWTHGGGHQTGTQSVLSVGVSSNSVNSHRNYSASGEMIRLLFTDQNGNNDGSEDATWSSHDASNSVTLDFTNVITSSTSGVSSSHATNPIVVWGFKTAKSGRAIDLAWTNNDDSSDGDVEVERYTHTLQSETINGKDVTVQYDKYGKWVCVQNYEHYGGNNPSVSPGSTFPQLPNGLTDETDVNDLGGNGELRHVDNIDQYGSWEVDTVRLEAVTENHNRKIHYFTQNQTVIDAIVTDSTSAGHTSLRDQTTYYDDHSANLPDTSSSNSTDSRTGRIFGYGFPMYEGGAHHWAVAGNGNRWEVDDYPSDASQTTVHRVWVRIPNSYNDVATGLTTSTNSYTDSSVSVGTTYSYRIERNTDHATATSGSETVFGTLDITIDGTTVTEVTIDGEDVTSLTIDGTTIF